MATSVSSAMQVSLTKRLRSAFSSQEVKNLATTIASLQAAGIKVDDVFPIGIVVQPDGVSIRGHVSAVDVKKLGELIPKIGDVREVRVFPRGIIAPDVFRVHVNLGR